MLKGENGLIDGPHAQRLGREELGMTEKRRERDRRELLYGELTRTGKGKERAMAKA